MTSSDTPLTAAPEPGPEPLDQPANPPVNRSSRPRWRTRLLRFGAAMMLGLIGAWLGLTLGGTVHHEVGPLATSMRVTPEWHGGTSVDIPPLGTLDLATHEGPLGITAALEGVDTEEARDIVADPKRLAGLEPQAVADLRWEVKMAAGRGLLASLVGAVLLSALALRRVSSALVGGGTALLAVGTAGAIAVATWNPAAFAEPRYTGLLTSAPSVVGNAESIVNDFSAYGDQLAMIVQNVSGLYAVTSDLPLLPPQQDLVRVLHVSDLHLAPQAWDLIRTVSKQYDIDVIVDSGDITDHGTRAENRYVEEIRRLKTPYVWVRGNHDSMLTQAAMEKIPNVVVLDGKVRKVAGLRFLGAGDPSFTPDKSVVHDDSALVTDAVERLAEQAVAAGGVDITVFHDPTSRELLDGTSQMALFGHFHNRKVTRGKAGTWLMLEGSTGGSGLRALEPQVPARIEMSVLYVDRQTGELRAYDDISLGGLGMASAQIERQVVEVPRDGTSSVSPQPSTRP